jgi:hypothetical protein
MILFGIHVAKCAGTTLFLRAMQQLRFNEVSTPAPTLRQTSVKTAWNSCTSTIIQR